MESDACWFRAAHSLSKPCEAVRNSGLTPQHVPQAADEPLRPISCTACVERTANFWNATEFESRSVAASDTIWPNKRWKKPDMEMCLLIANATV